MNGIPVIPQVPQVGIPPLYPPRPQAPTYYGPQQQQAPGTAYGVNAPQSGQSPDQLMMNSINQQGVRSPGALGADLLSMALMKYGGQNGGLDQLATKLMHPSGMGSDLSSI